MKAAPSRFRTRVVPAAAGAAMIAVVAAGAWYSYDYAMSQPIRSVVFVGDTGRVARADLDGFASSVQGAASGPASLAEVREGARHIPWVRDAAVRRLFPDAVEVSLETYEPLARWAEGGLVSTHGEIFVADYAAFLPVFRGPPASAARMAREYPAIVRALAPLASALVELRVTARGAWQVMLDSGLTLELGREDIVARIQRFASAWPRLPEGATEGKHADLRYVNGFAMRAKAK
jgi:cell division protein FtsQ